ncbi:MAG: amidohydrolase family protein [Deltaproteobacteria bacterium]|nr:amidohydrolase family protein [Deltaproteobacteria bacterium]
MDIIDFRVRPRTQWFLKDLVPKPIPAFELYLKLFGGTPDQKRLTPATVEESIEDMHEYGITKGVIFAGDAEGTANVVEVCEKFPDSYIGLAGVRPEHGVQKAYQDLKRFYLDHNLRGLNMSPYLTGVYATDRRNYPLYQLSEELGRCVVIHSSAHYNPNTPLDLSDPMEVDKVAVDFPDLKLVITHGGYGFGDLGPTIANRHKNVYLDLTSIHPRALTKTIIALANTQLRNKIIFGTNYPCFEYDIVELWKKTLDEKVLERFFYKNAARVLGLDG